MNADTLQGQWKDLKGKIRKRWGNLTDDEIDRVNGSYDQLVGKIKEKYGIAKDEAKKMIDDWQLYGRCPKTIRSRFYRH